MATPILEVRDLRVSFPTDQGVVQAVRGIDFNLEAGELLGVVGESGSGKSVTFLAVMGLLPARAVVTGSIKLAGKELIGSSKQEWRKVRGKEVAMIFQDPLSALNPTHQIGRQISEMVLAHNDVTKDFAAIRAVELLGLVGIPQPGTRAKQYPHEFSGGMRQRVMIAMAVANNPQILIADEPTTALDTTIQAQILEVIQRVQQELNTAVAFITHDLGVVARIADRVQVMYAGRIAERAQVHDIFIRPTHPYTMGLLHSLPSGLQERLLPIPGAPPDMIDPPSGCAFRVRCPHAAEICATVLPELRPYGVVETACLRVDEIMAGVKA